MRRGVTLLAGVGLLLAISAAGAAAHAGARGRGRTRHRKPVVSSFYTGPGPRPGPAILYAPPAVAPQLTNTGVWHAPPILVSGTDAYRHGEFLYQDYLYD